MSILFQQPVTGRLGWKNVLISLKPVDTGGYSRKLKANVG
jgi:hypothetical protein